MSDFTTEQSQLADAINQNDLNAVEFYWLENGELELLNYQDNNGDWDAEPEDDSLIKEGLAELLNAITLSPEFDLVASVEGQVAAVGLKVKFIDLLVAKKENVTVGMNLLLELD